QKHGVEKIKGENGKLSREIHWKNGIKDGKEIIYSEDGKKTEEFLWADGKIKATMEWYLNGKPKLREVFDGDTKSLEKYYDNGQLWEKGTYLRCKLYYWDTWCHDGEFKYFREDGSLHSVEVLKKGRLHSRRAFDPKGTMILDEEYEADGSRKLKEKPKTV